MMSREIVPTTRHAATWCLSVLIGLLLASTAQAQDQVFLVSTRQVGTTCNGARLAKGLHCEELRRGPDSQLLWLKADWQSIAEDNTPTVIYVHGNRIPAAIAKPHGLQVYQSLTKAKCHVPMRFIIWSWPSEKIRGQFKDYQVKAARTRPVGWQLAWAIDQLPSETPLGLVGYSYGARVTTGTLHLLAGGSLSGLKLQQRKHPQRPPISTVLIAAAINRQWLTRGGYHGRAGQMMDGLTLLTNRHDPAMKLYAFGTRQRGVQALGYEGISTRALAPICGKLQAYNATSRVGRDHSLHKYLNAVPQFADLKTRVATKPQSAESGQSETAIAKHQPGSRG